MGDDRFAALFREIKERMADNTDPTDFDINSWTGKFNEQILENATKSFSCPKKQNTQKKKVAKKPAIWYTNSCSASKKRYQRTLNKMTKNPFDKSIQQQYLVARKDYMLHFKILVTKSGHQSDKILMSSHLNILS